MDFRKHRKPLASLFLGVWLFAVFSTLAGACLTDGREQAPSLSGVTPEAHQHHGGHERPVGCEEFCNTDTPLLTKLQVDQDQPAEHPSTLAGVNGATTPVISYLKLPVSQATPPLQAPLLLRTLRLAL